MNDLVPLRRRQVDSHPKDLVEMFCTAARDSPTLLNSCCLTRSPSFICTFRRAGGSAAVWVAHILLAGGRALAPESLLLTLIGAVPGRHEAIRVPEVLSACLFCLASPDCILAHLWARLIEAVFILILILTALLKFHLILVSLPTLRWACWFVVTAVGIALVLEADPRAFILPACSSLATGFAGSVVTGGYIAVLLTGRVLHLILESLGALGGARQIAFLSVTVLLAFCLRLSSHVSLGACVGARQIAFLSVTVLLAFWLRLSRHVSVLTEGRTWTVATLEVGVL